MANRYANQGQAQAQAPQRQAFAMPEAALCDLLAEAGREAAMAARLAAVLAPLAGQRIDIEALRARGLSGAGSSAVPGLLEAFARRGLLTLEGTDAGRGRWSICVAAHFPSDLPVLLRGAAAALAVHKPETMVEVAITDVGPGTRFALALERAGLRAARLIATEAVFEDVALSAKRRLVVAMPFVNEKGAQRLLRLFERTPAPERVLIIRRRARVMKMFGPDAPRLAALGVRVVDYVLKHDEGFETFHAKVVLADEDFAYVGSANALPGDRVPLELGVRLRGAAVRDVAIAVDAVLEATRR